MKNIIIILLIFSVFSCSEKKKTDKNQEIQTVENKVIKESGFDLIQNFETNKDNFRTDTFELNEHSTDGGELIVFHNSKMEYLVLDFWLYGETGKLNYTYWTEKDFKIKFVKQIRFEYDKPYYEEGFKIDTITNYLSYLNTASTLYDKNKKEINNDTLTETKKKELESFFYDVTKDVEIIK